MTWVGRPKSPLPQRERKSLAVGHTQHTQMWVLRRLWAMLVLLLLEPWSTGYHHPYHHSPKLRKIQRPQGVRLHFWTIQSRLGNCANTQRSTATSSITDWHTNTTLHKSLIEEKQSRAGREKQKTEQVSKPSAITSWVTQTFYTHRHTHTLSSCIHLNEERHTYILLSATW